MFVVRTRLTAHGTPFAQDALACFKVMTLAGHEPTVATVGGKAMQVSGLERWAATIPRPYRRSGQTLVAPTPQ